MIVVKEIGTRLNHFMDSFNLDAIKKTDWYQDS